MRARKGKIKYKGFTLIELLIVLAIIAVLVFVAIPFFLSTLQNAKIQVDMSNCALLNRVTKIYRQEVPNPDPFLDSSKTDEELIAILVDGGMLSEALVPTATNASFEWDFDVLGWSYFVEGELVGDPLIENFIASIGTSAITYDTFISKNTRWASATADYNPTRWNGYLEKILERGDVESNERRDEDAGHNTIGYENPYSEKGTVVNYNNWNNFKKWYPEYVPPAILITNQSDFAPDSTSTLLSTNAENLKGTMVIYKSSASNTPNDQTVVYYILEDGTKSEIYSISEILN